MLENSSFRRIWGENTWAIPVRDWLGILRFSQFFCTAVITAISPLWPQLKCGQMQSESQTFNAEKPPKKAVFQRKVVGVQGLEPWASCSQTFSIKFFYFFRHFIAVFALLLTLFATLDSTVSAHSTAVCSQTCGQKPLSEHPRDRGQKAVFQGLPECRGRMLRRSGLPHCTSD